MSDWKKLLDVALANTQNTCLTLTELPQDTSGLQSLLDTALEVGSANNMQLTRVEYPLDRYEVATDTLDEVDVEFAKDVVRLTFGACEPTTSARRIVMPMREVPGTAIRRNRGSANLGREGVVARPASAFPDKTPSALPRA